MSLRPSAIRYYESLGILPPALRRSGQRRYDDTILYRLAVIQRARQTGFSLEEIRELFLGFGPATSASKRWQKMSRQKLAELDAVVLPAEACLDHHLFAVVRPALDEGCRREHHRLARLRLDPA